MVNLGLLIAGAVLAGVVFFRREIGEAGTLIGKGFGEFGTGVRTGVSALTSPSIRPEFVPTLGFKTELPGSCGPGENGELKSPFTSCRPGGVSPNPFLCCYPRTTATTTTPTSGYAIAGGPQSQLEADLASVRYDGRIEKLVFGPGGVPLCPSGMIPLRDNTGCYDPGYVIDVGESRLDGRSASNFP